MNQTVHHLNLKWRSGKAPFCGNLLALFLLACLPGALSAQVARSEIFGTVVDPGGAAVPGAEISIASESQGYTYRTASNEAGQYTIPDLIPGGYRLRVTKNGFAAFTQLGIQAIASKPIRINIALTVGQSEQTIDVVSDAPLLESGSNEVGQTIDSQRVAELPLNGRNYLQLATLGTNSIPMDTYGVRQGTNYILAGSRWNTNGLYID